MNPTRMLLNCFIISTLAVATSARNYQLPNSDAAHIIEVENLMELETRYAKSNGASDDVVFHLRDSKTFVAKEKKDYWDIEENLDELKGRKTKRNHEVALVEFGFEKAYIANSENRIPVSYCHSETEGQGGALNIQSSVGLGQSLTGSFGVNPNAVAFSLSLMASVGLEQTLLINTVIGCSAKHGEVVQLFLVDTKFIYYTPTVRALKFDKKTKRFAKPGKFEKKRQRRAVVKGGIGEWICGSSSVTPLQCSKLTTIITDF